MGYAPGREGETLRALGYDGAGVRVAVFDTGLRERHPAAFALDAQVSHLRRHLDEAANLSCKKPCDRKPSGRDASEADASQRRVVARRQRDRDLVLANFHRPYPF